MIACPEDQVLKQVLCDDMTAEEFDTVAAHVDLCPQCQEKLARITEDEATGLLLPPPRRSRRELSLVTVSPRDDVAVVEVEGFDILECLGRGGMGVVYKARDRKLKRLVALKMLPAGADRDPERVLRFRTEASAAARLHHPNIVSIYGISDAAGRRPYFSSEFVEGGTLAQHLAGAPQPAMMAATMVETLARAIDYAHGIGILHRDLKPANILLAKDEGGRMKNEPGGRGDSSFILPPSTFRPKIADFGLAKHLDGSSGLTHTGQVLGTPSYMAPEQALGAAEAIGPRTDVYALGAIFYEMLTGRPPFIGATALETLDQVRGAEPVPPSQLVPQVPRDAETICLKCLEKEPARRYASAAELADDLRRFLDREPIRARPAGMLERVWKWARRRPSAASLVAVSIVMFAAVVALAVGSIFYHRIKEERDIADGLRVDADRQRNQADRLRGAADEQSRRAEAAETTVRRLLYDADMLNAHQAFDEGNIVGMRELLDKYLPDAGGEDIRGFEWYYLRRLAHSELLNLRGHLGPVRCVAYSGDGTRLASGSYEGTVKVWDAATGRDLCTLRGHSGTVTGVAFGPRGKKLASCSWDKTVRVWDVDEQRVIRTLKGHTDMVNAVAFSPDGKSIASSSNDGAVRVWNADTGDAIHSLQGHKEYALSVAFSPRGERIASAGNDGTVRVWETESGKEVASFPDMGSGGVAFSPDGNSIASARAHDVTVMDLTSRELTHTFTGHTQQIMSVAFRPDGKTLASGSYDNTARLWDLAGKAKPRILKGHTLGVYGVAFSPDGQRLATASWDRTVKVWDLRRGPEAVTLLGDFSQVRCVAFDPTHGRLVSTAFAEGIHLSHPVTGESLQRLDLPHASIACLDFSGDGKLLATGHWDKNVYIWDLATGQLKRTLAGRHTAPVRAVAISPDGRLVASTGGDKVVTIWDLSGTTPTRTLEPHAQIVTGLDFSPDGKLLASSSDDTTIRIWTVDDSRPPSILRGHSRQVTGVAFSPDGKRLASSGFDLTVRIWDPVTGKNTQTLKGSTDGVHRPAFSPDGRRIAAGDQNNMVKVWDLDTGQLTLILKGHTHYVFTAAFSPVGEVLATGGGDGAIKLWHAPRTWPVPTDVASPAERPSDRSTPDDKKNGR